MALQVLIKEGGCRVDRDSTMKVLNIIDTRLDDLRGNIIDELDLKVRNILDSQKKVIMTDINIVNPFSNKYIHLKKISIDRKNQIRVEAECENCFSEAERIISFDITRLSTFDLLVVLRDLHIERCWELIDEQAG